jgi:hypothetical protein
MRWELGALTKSGKTLGVRSFTKKKYVKGQRNKSGWEEQEPEKNKDWEKINTDGNEFSARDTCK